MPGNTCIQDMDVSKKPTSLTRISVMPGNTCIQDMDVSKKKLPY